MGTRRNRRGRRLRIHRETLRTLSDRALSDAAGGTLQIVVVNQIRTDTGADPAPKTTVWGDNPVVVCTI